MGKIFQVQAKWDFLSWQGNAKPGIILTLLLDADGFCCPLFFLEWGFSRKQQLLELVSCTLKQTFDNEALVCASWRSQNWKGRFWEQFPIPSCPGNPNSGVGRWRGKGKARWPRATFTYIGLENPVSNTQVDISEPQLDTAARPQLCSLISEINWKCSFNVQQSEPHVGWEGQNPRQGQLWLLSQLLPAQWSR